MGTIIFLITLGGLISITLFVQLISRMKLVPPSQLAVVHGRNKTYRGGRIFVYPLIERFDTMDLTPQTTSVVVESAIASGIVPLTVTATVSYAISTSEKGRQNAIKRILEMTKDEKSKLQTIASSIIEGHLRDSIAAMTPEEVMREKDQLISNMIQICKSDLEGIGLEITTMNIADVDDHRLSGVEEKHLYIDLLKRVQTTNADSQSRQAKANAESSAREKEEQRRAEVEKIRLENERQNLEAELKVKIAREKQRSAVGAQEALRNAESEVAGIEAQIEAEKQRIEMVRAKCEAEILIPAQAERDKAIELSRAEAAKIRGEAQSELTQLKRTINILESAGDQGLNAYIIEKFDELVKPFAQTLELFPVEDLSVIAGTTPNNGPISSIHPHSIDLELNRRVEAIISNQQTLDRTEIDAVNILQDALGQENEQVEETSTSQDGKKNNPDSRQERVRRFKSLRNRNDSDQD